MVERASRTCAVRVVRLVVVCIVNDKAFYAVERATRERVVAAVVDAANVALLCHTVRKSVVFTVIRNIDSDHALPENASFHENTCEFACACVLSRETASAEELKPTAGNAVDDRISV